MRAIHDKLQSIEPLYHLWIKRPDTKKALGDMSPQLFLHLRIIVGYLDNPGHKKWEYNISTGKGPKEMFKQMLERYKELKVSLEDIVESKLSGGIPMLFRKRNIVSILDNAFNDLKSNLPDDRRGHEGERK